MSKKVLPVLAGAAFAVATAGVALALPARVFEGKPTLAPGKALGGFVWHDAGGVRVRFTTKGALHHFTGTVCTGRKIAELTPVKLEKVDKVRIGPHGHCIWYTFKTARHMDGFDFRAPGKVLTFTFRMDGKKLRTDQIWVGRAGVHPKNNPFVLTRK